MQDALQEGAILKVVGVQGKPQLNGTFVRLLRRLPNGRWETQGCCDPTQEAALRPQNLTGIPSLTRQLFYYLTEQSDATRLHFEAHANELPLLYFSTFKQLRLLLKEELGEQPSGCEKLEALRQAVRGMPGFSLARGDTCIRRIDYQAAEPGPEPAPAADVPAVVVLRIPTSESELPSLERVASRPDYLHVLAAALHATSVQPVPLQIPKGQVLDQPLLYVDPEQGAAPHAPPPHGLQGAGHHGARNPLASALCGAEVWGDALLASVELRGRDETGRPEVSIRRPVSVGDFEAKLAKRMGGVAGFIGFKYSRVLLGAWAVPRAGGDVGAGANRDKRYAEGARAWEGSKGPSTIMHEYLGQQQAQTRAHSLHDAANMTPPFVGRVEFRWPEGRRLPSAARRVEAGVAELRCEQPSPTKRSAENAAAVALLGALQALEPVEAPLQFLETRPPAFYAASNATHGGDGGGAAELHTDGTTLVVSLRLARLEWPPAEAAPQGFPPPWATLEAECGGDGSGEATDGGGAFSGGQSVERGPQLLEEMRQVPVLIGGRVVAVAVEEVLRATAARTEAACHVRVRYHGVPCWCVLHAVVHAVETPPEHIAQLLTGAGPGGHAEERLSFVSTLVRRWRPASLLDVGCGECRLLVRLVQDGASFPELRQLVGLEPDPRPSTLRRASARVAAARDVEAEAGRRAPSVQLYHGGLEEAWRVQQRCEVLTMVEVVEHLDPPQLASVGEALLGRLQPRRLIVTTPNKEYNLEYVPNPNTPGMAPEPLPPLATYPLRNSDHRFEWTRDEFRQWATALAQEHGYSVSYHGVGGGPLDEEAVHGEWRGVGPITQVAVFEAIAPLAAGVNFEVGPPLEQVWSAEERHALP